MNRVARAWFHGRLWHHLSTTRYGSKTKKEGWGEDIRTEFLPESFRSLFPHFYWGGDHSCQSSGITPGSVLRLIMTGDSLGQFYARQAYRLLYLLSLWYLFLLSCVYCHCVILGSHQDIAVCAWRWLLMVLRRPDSTGYQIEATPIQSNHSSSLNSLASDSPSDIQSGVAKHFSTEAHLDIYIIIHRPYNMADKLCTIYIRVRLYYFTDLKRFMGRMFCTPKREKKWPQIMSSFLLPATHCPSPIAKSIEHSDFGVLRRGTLPETGQGCTNRSMT